MRPDRSKWGKRGGGIPSTSPRESGPRFSTRRRLPRPGRCRGAGACSKPHDLVLTEGELVRRRARRRFAMLEQRPCAKGRLEVDHVAECACACVVWRRRFHGQLPRSLPIIDGSGRFGRRSSSVTSGSAAGNPSSNLGFENFRSGGALNSTARFMPLSSIDRDPPRLATWPTPSARGRRPLLEPSRRPLVCPSARRRQTGPSGTSGAKARPAAPPWPRPLCTRR